MNQAGHLPDFKVLNEYKKVETFINMGSTTEAIGGSWAEIRCRITLRKSAMTRLWNVTCNQKIFKEPRKDLIRTLVFPVVLYASEI